MKYFISPVPARPSRLAGTFVFLGILLFFACDRNGAGRGETREPRVLELSTDTVSLPDSILVSTVRMDRSKRPELTPVEVTVRTGDVVRFLATDGSAHALAFDGDSLAAPAREFMERTGQLRSPPLLMKDATWLVSMAGAPPGRYPFRCPTHGAAGAVIVTAR